jgi:chorismate lyase
MDAAAVAWLGERGSLVKKIADDVGVDCRVDPVFEAWGTPWRDEADALSCAVDEAVWAREVTLRCDSEVMVFARSLFSKALFESDTRFHHLGSQGIGTVLFNSPHAIRGDIEVAVIDSSHALHQQIPRWVGSILPRLWARRSLFTIDAHTLLVCEVFLSHVIIS